MFSLNRCISLYQVGGIKIIVYLQLEKCGRGVIGSRARLRIWCREAWGFESLRPHIINNHMNISRTNTDELNAVVRLSIEKSDYEATVNETLKDYRKKPTCPVSAKEWCLPV